MAQTITATGEGVELVWIDGEFSGDQGALELVTSKIDEAAAGLFELPFGYPPTAANPTTVELAMRAALPGFEITADPPIAEEDEVLPIGEPDNSITEEELGIQQGDDQDQGEDLPA